MSQTVSITILTADSHAAIGVIKDYCPTFGLTVSDSVDSNVRLTTVSMNELSTQLSLRIDMALTKLREIEISYSHDWSQEASGGESHFRVNAEGVEQHLSWTDNEKNMMPIDDVRDAVVEGETACFELLDQAERAFIPWSWDEAVSLAA